MSNETDFYMEVITRFMNADKTEVDVSEKEWEQSNRDGWRLEIWEMAGGQTFVYHLTVRIDNEDFEYNGEDEFFSNIEWAVDRAVIDAKYLTHKNKTRQK